MNPYLRSASNPITTKRCVGLAAAALLSMPLSAAETTEAPNPGIPTATLSLKPNHINSAESSGAVDIVLTVPHLHIEKGETLFSLNGGFGDFSITDSQGEVPVVYPEPGGGSFPASRTVDGDVTIRYTSHLSNSFGGPVPVATPRIDGGDGFLSSGNFLIPNFDIRSPYKVSIHWDLSAMSPGCSAVSSYGDGDVEIGAGTLSRIGQAMFMAGHIKRQDESGNFSALWLSDVPDDIRTAMSWAARLHAVMPGFFLKDKLDSPYRVFLRLNADVPAGGMAMENSFVVGYDQNTKSSKIQSLLGHEMVHTFTSNLMDKWYVEGDAVYYQQQLAWRAGMRTSDEYLKDINETAAAYYASPLIGMPNDKIRSDYWGDVMKIMLPYDRGAIYFAALNGILRKASGGTKSVDDLIREMVSRQRAGQPVNEKVWTELVADAAGEEGVALHNAMIKGETIVPDSDAYGPRFRRVQAKIRRFDKGIEFESNGQTQWRGPEKKKVVAVKSGSEADKAGIKVGDEVSLSNMGTDGALHNPNATTDATVTRDGKTFVITYLPRGEAVDGYQWERVPGSPEDSDRPLSTR